jgi:chromate transport protein ChrA
MNEEWKYPMSIATHGDGAKDRRPGSPLEVLLVYLKLGVTCFGGPIAHIGYFREEFVVRRRWLEEQAYADVVGLCQFLPGPASSQVGFALGLMRAGYRGGLAAWTGFTPPSAIALVLFAYGAGTLGGPIGIGLPHGLKLVAVAIVAQAVWGMARTLCPDRERASIAVVAALIILFSTSSIAQIAAILLGGIAGLWLCQSAPPPSTGHVAVPVSRTVGLAALTAFFLLLVGLPVLWLNRAKIAAALEAGGGSQRPEIDPITLSIEAKLRRAGKGKRLVIANGAKAEVNAGLVELIKDAFTIRIQLLSGSDDSIEAMSGRLGMNKCRLTSLVRLSYLAPDIVRALLEGRQPIELTPTRLLRLSKNLPHDWKEQRCFLGFPT